jgi:hypothetical protein
MVFIFRGFEIGSYICQNMAIVGKFFAKAIFKLKLFFLVNHVSMRHMLYKSKYL